VDSGGYRRSAADRVRDPAAEALRPWRQPPLAPQWLRYVGEPVAVVFANDPYLAEDAG
jgi:aerobic carbon-monoxide dehydrogenase large subunit